MTRFSKLIIVLVLTVLNFLAGAQNSSSEKLVVFTSRDYCVSGDTVWFKVWQPKTLEKFGNVARVQLFSIRNNVIKSVAGKIENGWAEGYLHVPDSLSTGQYFVSAFLNNRDYPGSDVTESVGLLVYNRFNNKVESIETITDESKIKFSDFSEKIKISTEKAEFRPREKVLAQISIPENFDFESAVIKAKLVDPLAEELGGSFLANTKTREGSIPGFTENNGLLCSGRVFDVSGNAKPGVLVFATISADMHYFDYYLTGKNGDFHFFLKDASGVANMVLQVVSESNEKFVIRAEENCIVGDFRGEIGKKELTKTQSGFIAKAVDAGFYQKMFYPIATVTTAGFSMPPKFETPFYGTPSLRVVPDEFIDLPDFREISRELLPGLQYRLKNNEITFRLINDSRRDYFNDEPLRLINGIPVFKNSQFAALKSTNIKYIDMVKSERIFGDLKFNGILSVELYDKTNLWVTRQPEMVQLTVNCLQPALSKSSSQKNFPQNMPDMRQSFFWEIAGKTNTEFEFYLSDVKGRVEISVEGISLDKKHFKSSRIIEVN